MLDGSRSTEPRSPWGGGVPVVVARSRQKLILEALRSSGSVRVAELVDRLGVSDVTIRRDITELSRLGLADRVHGGAALPEGFGVEFGFPTRDSGNRHLERSIGELAASLVQPGSSVALSAGTATLDVATALQAVAGLTVVTNSPTVAQVLHEPSRHDRTVILTGGMRNASGALVGPVANRSLEPLHVDLLFLDVHGFSAAEGLTSSDLAEGETNRALIAAAACTVLVAGSDRWGVVGLATIAGLDEVDVLVSDDGLPQAACTAVGDRGGQVLVAPVGGGGTG